MISFGRLGLGPFSGTNPAAKSSSHCRRSQTDHRLIITVPNFWLLRLVVLEWMCLSIGGGWANLQNGTHQRSHSDDESHSDCGAR